MRRVLMGFTLAVVLMVNAWAQDAPVVVELFTSQGCSSCPSADAFLTDLARQRQDVLPLAFHVTYWDHLGWKDPYTLDAATARQHEYAKLLDDVDGVYTPQMVVDGATGFVGSNRSQGLAAIGSATRKPVAVSLTRKGTGLAIAVGAGLGDARVLLVGFDPEHETRIGRGENGGRKLTESNVVRSLTLVGTWSGSAIEVWSPSVTGEGFAVLLQARDGHIIGAARLHL